MERKKRWLLVVLLFVANTINYIDRVNISVAGPEIAQQFGLGPEALGIVFSCFFYSYTLLVLPMGLLTDRFGARFVMNTAMVIWALGSLATGSASSFTLLIAARLLLGIGESSSYPACNRIIREWAPRGERATMVSIFNSGAVAGPAIGILATAALISHFDWRTSFYIAAALTLLFALFWMAFYRSPEQARWLHPAERDHILTERDTPRAETVHAMPFRALLRQRVMWGLLLTQGCMTYNTYLFLTWLPSYLRTVRHLELFNAGWLGMLPYLVSTFGSIALGALSDVLVRKADLSRGARRHFIVVVMICASCVLLVPFVDSIVVMEILVIASILCTQTAGTVNFALAGDLIYDKKSAATVYSLIVFGGNIFGLIAPILTGFIISYTKQYDASFVIAGVLLLAGSAITLIMVRGPLQPPSGTARSVITAPSPEKLTLAP
jgi:sugar phosphate permease